MIQLYLLSVAYLVIGSGFLLSDTHGIRMSILFSLRFTFRNNRAVRLGLIIGGFLLTVGLALFPIDPGPRIIGDLLPMINVFVMSVWYLSEARQKPETDELITSVVGRYRERMGYVTLAVALLHFLLPHFVLL
ncbi:MAG: hypothetical protein GX911_04170 [Spirochaetales bacterium]|nr:hypothetical protein [Spirochaetales bacterium]